MLLKSEKKELLNLIRARGSDMRANTFAEKKVRPGLHHKERSKVKWLKKAEMISVLPDTRE